MYVIHQLSSAQGSNRQDFNKALAKKIASRKNKNAIKELIDLLSHFDKKIRHDVIKVLCEIGAINPKLIADYLQHFLKLLDDNDNKMQWGGMTAVSYIAPLKPHELYLELPKLLEVADSGSVITRDKMIATLVHIGSEPKYSQDVFNLLIEQLKSCPVNQLPNYAELTATLASKHNRDILIETIEMRDSDVDILSKKKRLQKLKTHLIQL